MGVFNGLFLSWQKTSPPNYILKVVKSFFMLCTLSCLFKITFIPTPLQIITLTSLFNPILNRRRRRLSTVQVYANVGTIFWSRCDQNPSSYFSALGNGKGVPKVLNFIHILSRGMEIALLRYLFVETFLLLK